MKRPFTKPAWFLEIILSKIFFILLAIAVDPILYITDKSDMSFSRTVEPTGTGYRELLHL